MMKKVPSYLCSKMKTVNTETEQLKKISKYKLLKTSWKYQLTEFFNNSNLHGIRYIAQKDRPFHEKFIWFCSILTGLVVTLVIISSLWEKFQTSPTITGLDTDFYKWDIPFPAITVCPHDPVDKNLVENYIFSKWGKLLDNVTYEYYQQFVIRIANLSYINIEDILMYSKSKDQSFADLNLKDLAMKVVIGCKNLLYGCSWKGHPYQCCSMFQPVFTDRGFCYTFNSKHFEHNFPRLNTTQMDDVKIKYIYETDNDLSLVLNSINLENPLSVYIHSQAEKMVWDMPPHHVWTKRISKISFSPRETYTTENARQLNIKQRRCVFPDEIHLLTDDVYTFGACMTQCRMNMAKQRCGCIPFFYEGIDGYKGCNVDGLFCIALYREELKNSFSCDCELSCMNTVYEVEKLEDAKKDSFNAPLEISFVSWPMIRYKRDVLFGWVDLFVAFGGIAGLFLGFSVLSAIEAIYFFTLRACCMVYREQDKLIELYYEFEQAAESEINLDLKPYISSCKPNKNENENVIGNDVYLPYLP